MCILFTFFVKMSTLYLHKIRRKNHILSVIFTKMGCLYALFRAAAPVSGSEICIRANIPAAAARCTLRSNGPLFARVPKNV